MPLTSYLAFSVKIDWNNDLDFLDAGEDVTANARYPLNTRRGRASVNDEFAAGSGSFALKNDTGDYSPLYASSPLYPNVLPGRGVQVQVTYNAITYPVFKGRCTPESQSAQLPQAEVSFSMVDAFEQLRLGLTNTPILQNDRVDEVITAVLDDIDWPAGDRTLDVSGTTLAVFTNHNRLPINALQLATAQDPGASLFMGRDGKVTFQNRTNRSSQAVYATLAGTFETIDPQLRQEDLIDSVRATYPRLELGAALATVWTLSLAKRLEVGVTEFEVGNNASGVLGGSGYATPVATTDYVANSASDGSGTSKTAQVTAAIVSSSSGGAVLQFTNLDSSAVFLMAGGSTKLRAYPLQAGGEVNAVKYAVLSPVITGQKLTRDFEFNQSVDEVSGWASWQRVRGAIRPRPVVTIVPDTDALMAIVLGAEIGKKVILTDTAAPWLTQVNGTYFVEGIDMEYGGAALVKATWRLFDAEMAIGNMFRVSGASGGGADYSTIGSAVPTSGDRIGY